MRLALLALLVLLLPAWADAQGITRYVRFQQGTRISYGILDGETIRELDGDLFEHRPTNRTVRAADVKLLAPIDPARVSKVLGVAVNTRRPGREVPVDHPRFFAKLPTSIIGPDDAVEHPPESQNTDWEGELVLVIGRNTRHVSVEDAPKHIFGVSVGNDISENTWYGERQGVGEPTRLISKAADTWAPLGPAIVTGIEYGDLKVDIRVNGDLVASGRTSQLLNGPAQLVSYISRYVTLLPGDLIYTGTYPTLAGKDNTVKPGDVMEIEIEKLGRLRNSVVAMRGALPAPRIVLAKSSSSGFDATVAPQYQVEPLWPKPLPNKWILGQVSGIAVDSRDHVWVVHRPRSLTTREAGAVQNPPLGECCVPAPPVIEFDPDGNVVQAWGGPGQGYRWPESEHGLYVDAAGNVWIASDGDNDHVVLKFSRDGKLLLQIGEPGKTGGSNDTRLLGEPTDVAVDQAANEVYIADGYVNRRVIVFDATTGVYKRHWGAYGRKPEDGDIGRYDPQAPPAQQFRSPVHAVRLSNDGLVYVADRVNNRIQVFRKNGEFVNEGFVAKNTRAMGSIWDMEFSPDRQQTYLYVPDGTNNKVWILKREDLGIVGTFGSGGRNAGQFGWVHNLAVDSKGNAYTSEVENYKRVQMFRYAPAGAPR